jgi:hypothetical protein
MWSGKRLFSHLFPEAFMSDRISRKSVLISLLGAPLAAAALVTRAEAKTAPSAVQYVPKSKNGKYCEACRFYVGSPKKTGSCSIVSGPIEPMGYCVAYSKKS